MSNQEILERAIQKAIDGGWQGFSYEPDTFTGPEPQWFLGNKYFEDIHQFADVKSGVDFELNELIFNHDFAKSLWPTQASGSVDPRAVSPSTARPLIPTWQARLMEMVVSEDPIAYLGENI